MTILNISDFKQIKSNIENRPDQRSAWSKGVTVYAVELINELIENLEYSGEGINYRQLSKSLLNGASDWNEYSAGGCSLIYDTEIAERLCNPSELKRTKNGQNDPNRDESWIDVQARALFQAANLILKFTRRYADQ